MDNLKLVICIKKYFDFFFIIKLISKCSLLQTYYLSSFIKDKSHTHTYANLVYTNG